jgi:hypothetical protein
LRLAQESYVLNKVHVVVKWLYMVTSLEGVKTVEDKASEIEQFAKRYSAERVRDMTNVFMAKPIQVEGIEFTVALTEGERANRIDLIWTLIQKLSEESFTKLKQGVDVWVASDKPPRANFSSKVITNMQERERSLYGAALYELGTIYIDNK